MKNKNLNMVLSVVALLMLCVSAIVGLMPIPERLFFIDKVSLFLGLALLGFSYLTTMKIKQ